MTSPASPDSAASAASPGAAFPTVPAPPAPPVPATLALPEAPVRLSGLGLVLREWVRGDLTAMREAFDDAEVDRWTPLPSPFDHAAAVDRLARAAEDRAAGRRLCLAVTEDGGPALGEVLVFPDAHAPGGVEVGYGINPRHRGRGLASRGVRLMTEFAYDTLRAHRVVLRIDVGNDASSAVARATGFVPDGAAPTTEMSKGRAHRLVTWVHPGRHALDRAGQHTDDRPVGAPRSK
ncbi:GNAT family N-acetyltransferase [Yinghuangia sp. YIM S09857]|uniref:GNAT family N-acetyltransferase n=1 Tax=Yinghuangia sp. YIM S09857 TaxID=3436929 RepID=UPI003F537AC7